MVIKFVCPNGHQLSAPENMAGKAGKCPKCQTAFVVPKPDDPSANGAQSSKESQAETAAASTAATAEAAAKSSASGKNLVTDAGESRPSIGMGSGKQAADPNTFVFLCPNGHKLNGPPSLKGKAGKCPHCGAKFLIPTDDEEEEEEAEEEVPTGEAEQEEEEEIAAGELEEEQAGGFNFNFMGQQEDAVDAAVDESLAPPPPGTAALGYILGRLWDNKTDATEIEIFLVEGEIMTPDHFSEILSSSDFGVFAVKEGDDTYAITVIPWSAVRRIGVRKVAQLPPEAFR